MSSGKIECDLHDHHILEQATTSPLRPLMRALALWRG